MAGWQIALQAVSCFHVFCDTSYMNRISKDIQITGSVGVYPLALHATGRGGRGSYQVYKYVWIKHIHIFCTHRCSLIQESLPRWCLFLPRSIWFKFLPNQPFCIHCHHLSAKKLAVGYGRKRVISAKKFQWLSTAQHMLPKRHVSFPMAD